MRKFTTLQRTSLRVNYTLVHHSCWLKSNVCIEDNEQVVYGQHIGLSCTHEVFYGQHIGLSSTYEVFYGQHIGLSSTYEVFYGQHIGLSCTHEVLYGQHICLCCTHEVLYGAQSGIWNSQWFRNEWSSSFTSRGTFYAKEQLYVCLTAWLQSCFFSRKEFE